ncbi:arf-GAP with dual PH domain-containing protein 2 isoform X2 [Engraulis encrasicolus]|uniref:arf-GAP with dual PH domain-containing protein 2 isoform X2 n=1 Tax=Engraulis encrasicolus TaxID=184585 RepID=UPI002FCE7B8C
MANHERNKKILLELAKQPDNNRCADCCAPEPDWASYKLGVFVCLKCSGTHRNLPTVSRIKSIRLDFWDDELVEFMKANGNRAAREIYEKDVPAFYYRPQPGDCEVLREQWIRAKYERLEFTAEKNLLQKPYTSGVREGILWKKGKDNGHFQKRKFVLSFADFSLKYFNKEDESKGPKSVIAIRNLNATFQPQKIGHAHGLQIAFSKEGCTRNLFVYHENGQEIVTWFNTIRAARFAYLKTAYPSASDTELLPQITRSYLKEGFMEKTGPSHREPFKRRWFILDALNRKLLYFKSQLDAEELGVVFLGSEKHGYSASESSAVGARGNKWKYGLAVHTPERKFLFMCEQEREQREWLEALRQVIATPMQPQHYTTEATLKRRR